MQSGDSIINNIIMSDSYISCASEEAVSATEIRLVTIDMTDFLNIEFTKKWSPKEPIPHRIRRYSIASPHPYMDPQLLMIKYITVLMEKKHRFRLLDGTELNYDGYDPTRMPRFITRDRGGHILSTQLRY